MGRIQWDIFSTKIDLIKKWKIRTNGENLDGIINRACQEIRVL